MIGNEKMHNLIGLIRDLRRVLLFKVSTRILIIFLMIMGAWVATQTLAFPEVLDINDKLIHLFVFFAFALLADLAVSRHPFWLWKGLPLLIYGIGIEILQYYSPDRSFSLLDMVADFSGILLYFLVKMVLLWLDSKRWLNRRY